MMENLQGATIVDARQRRTPRLALGLPIRVFATDFKGRSFVEDSTTIAINLHGAKIRLGRELVPEQELRILSGKTGREAIFRVVGKAADSENRYTVWGVECLNPDHNIWGVAFPPLGLKDQVAVRVTLRCPECRVRETVYLNEPLLETIDTVGGLLRGCLTCGKTGQWKRIPCFEC